MAKLDRSAAAKRYIAYVGITGAVFAFLQFGEVIARKSLNASALAVTLLVMSMPVAAFTSLWWARVIEGRDQRRYLIVFGLVGYLALATGAMLFRIEHMLAMHFVYFLVYALLGPAENRILQQHVLSNRTGRTFGTASGLRMGVAAVFSGLAGLWMEHVDGGFRVIYPAVAVVGLAALVLIASIRTGPSFGAEKLSGGQLWLTPLRDVYRLLKRRKDYLRYEIAFMIYGIAFMMALPVVPLYLVDNLGLGYGSIGAARGMVNQLVMILGIPLFGRLFDRSTPHRMGMFVFWGLSLYPILLLSAEHFSGTLRLAMVYIAFAYFGIVMSGVLVVWQLASIRFAGKEDAGIYQSVHVAATGIRGLFAPLMGYLAMSTFGNRTALLFSSGLWIVAGFAMAAMRKIDAHSGEYFSLRAELLPVVNKSGRGATCCAPYRRVGRQA